MTPDPLSSAPGDAGLRVVMSARVQDLVGEVGARQVDDDVLRRRRHHASDDAAARLGGAVSRTHDHASWCATFNVGTAPMAAVYAGNMPSARGVAPG